MKHHLLIALFAFAVPACLANAPERTPDSDPQQSAVAPAPNVDAVQTWDQDMAAPRLTPDPPPADPIPASFCGDLLRIWGGVWPAPVQGPTSPATDALFADFLACETLNCSADCSGSVFATPPQPIDGSPGSAACKACLVSPCLALWNACVDDHDPANLCWQRGTLDPADQTCVTADDCVGFTVPACGLVCDPATGLNVGVCWEYEE